MKQNTVDEHGIAARIRGLLGTTEGVDYAFSARRLGVSEVALRMSADHLDPHPTFDVLLAVIREYGVDPAWLVTGHYDSHAHRATLDTSDEHRTSRVLTDLFLTGSGNTLPAGERLEA